MLSLKKSFGSLLDQVLLSGLNFGIAFLLIRGITKSEYGLYVQLWMIGLLATVILDALLGNSFNILNNRPANIRPENLLKNTHWLSLVVSLIASAFGFICSLLLTADWASWVDRLMLAVAYIFYLFFMIGREFKRLSFYLTDDWRSATTL